MLAQEGTDRIEGQRRIIQAALDKLGLPANAEGFAELGGRVALRGRTIYTAWLGNKPLGKAAMNTLRAISEEQKDPLGAMASLQITLRIMRDIAFERQQGRPTFGFGSSPLPLAFVPLLSMAHAGELASYEELPIDWQNHVPSPFPDPHAFALTIEGDCMLPEYRSGDVVIVSPSESPKNAQPAVVRLKSGDVVFRIYTAVSRTKAKLSCLNSVYPAIEIEEDELQWIYPVQFMVRRTSR